MNEWLHDSPIKGTTFKANLVMSSLLLQKPSQESKSKEHLEALEPRMDLWKSEEILQLLHEGETIQKYSRPANTPSAVTELPKKFTREMYKGNVTNAMKLLTDNMQNGILPLNHKILNYLKQ